MTAADRRIAELEAERDRLVSGMAEALEQRDAMRHQRDRAHATLRRIAEHSHYPWERAVARERLENP